MLSPFRDPLEASLARAEARITHLEESLSTLRAENARLKLPKRPGKRVWLPATLGIALGCGGYVIALVAWDNGRREAEARTSALRSLGDLQHSATSWRVERTYDQCPTVRELLSDHTDSGLSPVDPWGQPYILSCDETVARSSGPDKVLGTIDDIVAKW
jgi:hypothetical protein